VSAPALPSVPASPEDSAPSASPLHPPLECTLEIQTPGGDGVVVTVRGPLDLLSERMSRATLTAVAAVAAGPVVVVLDDSFVDFRGLAVLLGVARSCRRRGHMLRLVGVPPSMRTMCEALGVRNCWWEFPTTAEALAPREADEAEQLRQERGAADRPGFRPADT
jgi:anti-anti-sigma factor